MDDSRSRQTGPSQAVRPKRGLCRRLASTAWFGVVLIPSVHPDPEPRASEVGHENGISESLVVDLKCACGVSAVEGARPHKRGRESSEDCTKPPNILRSENFLVVSAVPSTGPGMPNEWARLPRRISMKATVIESGDAVCQKVCHGADVGVIWRGDGMDFSVHSSSPNIVLRDTRCPNGRKCPFPGTALWLSAFGSFPSLGT